MNLHCKYTEFAVKVIKSLLVFTCFFRWGKGIYLVQAPKSDYAPNGTGGHGVREKMKKNAKKIGKLRDLFLPLQAPVEK